MKLRINSAAEQDLGEGYWFYEQQSIGLGDYFRTCLYSDIESLVYYAGIHETVDGYFRTLAKRFPYAIYYEIVGEVVLIVAVLDCRRDPLWIRNRLSSEQ